MSASAQDPKEGEIFKRVNEALCQGGIEALEKGDYETAIENFSKLLDRDPAYCEAETRLKAAEEMGLAHEGRTARREKRCEEALNKFTELKKRNPAYPDIDRLLNETKKECSPNYWMFAIIGLIVLAVIGGLFFAFQLTSPPPLTGLAEPTEELSGPPTAESTAVSPTQEPATAPPVEPVIDPTEEATTEPTVEATSDPPAEPTPTVQATAEPTAEPTSEPTLDPTQEVTTEPTSEPTTQPTEASTTIDPATLPGKIAVPVFNTQTQTYDLYLVSGPDWRLPSEPFQPAASQPAFSPDGSEIVFRSWGGETTSYSEQLLRRSVSGTNDQPVTRNIEDARPHWSAVQSDVILHHSRPAGLEATVYLQGIWAGALDNPDSRQDIAIGENPTWLPDGRIVYASGTPEGIGLYVVDQAGNGLQKIWSSSNIVAPKGSPQENVVVFSNGEDLYVLPVTGGQSEAKRLTETPQSRERWPVWSPDGQYLAFVADADSAGQWAVYVMRADGTGRTKLFDLPGPIDGRPANVPHSSGWTEEQLAWGP